jgi:hypothetical protein
MIDNTTHNQIVAIHHAARPTVIEYAGAGSQALWWLHSVAGSSRTILEATDRYSRTSMENLLGQTPAQFVSQATAVAMAHASYRRAMDLSNNAAVVALACTATIATDRVKFGDHGCWVTTRDQHHIISYGLTLNKGARDRSGEEAVVSTLLIQALAYAVGVIPTVALDLLPGERFDIITTHSLLPYGEERFRRQLVANWQRCLAPGGAVVTVTRIGSVPQVALPPSTGSEFAREFGSRAAAAAESHPRARVAAMAAGAVVAGWIKAGAGGADEAVLVE